MEAETEKEVRSVLVAVRSFVEELAGLAKDLRKYLAEHDPNKDR